MPTSCRAQNKIHMYHEGNPPIQATPESRRSSINPQRSIFRVLNQVAPQAGTEGVGYLCSIGPVNREKPISCGSHRWSNSLRVWVGCVRAARSHPS